MTTLNTAANTTTITATLNGVVVTVIEVKKGGWTTVQLSTGDTKSVRTNTLVFNDTVTEDKQEDLLDMDTYQTMAQMDDVQDFSELFASTEAMEKEAVSFTKTMIAQCLVDLEAEAVEAAKAELTYIVARGLGYINAVKVLKEVSLDSLEGRQILRGVLEYSRSFKRLAEFKAKTPVNSGVDYRVTVGQYIADTLAFYSKENNLGTALVEEFNWGIANINNKYRCLTDEEVTNSKSYSNKNLDLEYIAPIDQPIRVAVRFGAVVLTAKAGTVITYNNGTKFTVKAERSVGITAADVKAGVLSTMSRIVFHNEVEKVDGNGKVTTYFTEVATDVAGSIFNKIFMIKSNKVNIDKLLDDKTGIKTKVVTIKTNGKLEDLAYPAHNLFGTYGHRSGMVSLQDAKSGYLVNINNIRTLIEFNDGLALSVENINKAIARADKQEKDNGWEAGVYRMFVAYDLTTGLTPIANEILVTGTAFFPEIFFDRYGLSRVTSRMFKGGLKAATHFDCDFETRYPNRGLVGPSAFKGGFLGLLSLLGKELETLGTLDEENTQGRAQVDVYQKSIESRLDTITFQGEEVKGLWVDIPVRITNAVMVEQYQWAGEATNNDSLLERASNLSGMVSVPNGFRDHAMAMAVADPNFSMVDYIQQGLEDTEDKPATIVEKANITRHTASLFQSAVSWHGLGHITKLIKALVKSMPKGRGGKVLAAQYLTGKQDVIGTADARDIAEVMITAAKEFDTELLLDVATYPIAVRSKLLSMFQYDAESFKAEWIELNFNGNKVCIPTHTFMYDFNRAIENGDKFTATGFLKEVLEAVKKAIHMEATETQVNYRLKVQSLNMEGNFLQARLQSKLLGKNFGHLYTVGTYQLMLPSLNRDMAIYEVEVVDGSMFMPTDEFGVPGMFPGVLPVNGVKYPAYFQDAFAGYMMFETDMGSPIVNFAMRKACFMHPETIMIMQNDCDGDLHQFTNDGYQLPLYRGPRGQFNEVSFTNFLEKEAKGNTLAKRRKLHKTTMQEFQAAIFAAGNAKDNIGKYTATKYTYETLLQGVDTCVTSRGIVEVTKSLRNQIMATLSYLCQVEAMDNIKQNTNGDVIANIMDLVATHHYSKFQDFGTKTGEQRRIAAIEVVTERLNTLFKEEGWNVAHDFAGVMAEVLQHVAELKSAHATPAYNVFNARVNDEKNFNNLVLEAQGEAITESFNYEGQYLTCINGTDSASMYGYILKALVRTFG